MPILPVIDVKGGVVVRGIAGRRAEYRPMVSELTPSCFPVTVAQALRERFGFHELYLADLDAIAGAAPGLGIYADLQADGFSLWVDAGLRRVADASPLQAAGVDSIIAGLESLDGPQALAELFHVLGPARLVFSLDLKEGQPLGRADRWPASAWDIALVAMLAGVRRLLILDLAHVGVGRGSGTHDLCARLRRHDATLQITTGGGVRDDTDVQDLYRHGVDFVLVASALHDGRLGHGRHS